VSRAGLTKTTLVAGRETRRLSQTVTPSPNEMFGPSTTTYSSGCWASHGSSRSVVSTDWQPGGRAPSSRRAVVLSGSTMTGMSAHLPKRDWTKVDVPGPGLTLLSGVSRPKVRSSALDATITFCASFWLTAIVSRVRGRVSVVWTPLSSVDVEVVGGCGEPTFSTVTLGSRSRVVWA